MDSTELEQEEHQLAHSHPDAPIISPDLHKRYLCTVWGAWCAEFASYPLDVVKTRLQIQGLMPASHL